MKSKILTAILITFVGFIGVAQNSVALVADQNPNYQTSLNKYMVASKVTHQTLTQGTTTQETYTPIDPMEEKRKRKELKKHYKSQRPLWRHQERMESAKNPSYYNRGYRNYNTRNNYNNRWFNSQSLLNLGMLSYLIFD
tara:strand:+ start:260 stop:676 length:417 start_codon:yes stop_codon:yes gene_type:complete